LQDSLSSHVVVTKREIPFGPWPVANARRGAIVLHCNFQERRVLEALRQGLR
jgi:hypothetical protein